MTPDAVHRAAEILGAARRSRTPVGPVPADCRPPDESSAYEIQGALHDWLEAAGHGRVAGHKIGCTTPVMRAYMSIESPCAGGVLAPGVRQESGAFGHAEFVRVGVECEIAVRLAVDLPPAMAPFTRAAVEAAVGECMAAIEVVDDRYVDYGSLDTPTLIADDFFAAACVLGPGVGGWRAIDLAQAVGRMTVNGVEVGTGRGADVMGHPFEALVWLANGLARQGRGLEAGEFVLTGSVVETKWLEPGDEVVAAIEGLGEARARFA